MSSRHLESGYKNRQGLHTSPLFSTNSLSRVTLSRGKYRLKHRHLIRGTPGRDIPVHPFVMAGWLETQDRLKDILSKSLTSCGQEMG